jgi:hypothetical protein
MPERKQCDDDGKDALVLIEEESVPFALLDWG